MRLTFRVAEERDAAAIAAIYAPYVEKTTVSFEYVPPAEEEMRARLIRIRARFPYFVCEADGRIAGYAYADAAFERVAYRWCADLSVYVDENFRGLGIGRRLVSAVEEVCKKLGYRKIYALVTGENESSLAFHRALRYTQTAKFEEQGVKFGRWLSVFWLEKQLNGGEVSVSFPRSFQELKKEETDAILSAIEKK